VVGAWIWASGVSVPAKAAERGMIVYESSVMLLYTYAMVSVVVALTVALLWASRKMRSSRAATDDGEGLA
jgi:membrane protein DedA with SNARE-associated domain